jgi:hypothetical protein
MTRYVAMLPLFLLGLAGCQLDSREQILTSVNSAAAQRAISTRAYDTGDRERVFRAIIATLLELPPLNRTSGG